MHGRSLRAGPAAGRAASTPLMAMPAPVASPWCEEKFSVRPEPVEGPLFLRSKLPREEKDSPSTGSGRTEFSYAIALLSRHSDPVVTSP